MALKHWEGILGYTGKPAFNGYTLGDRTTEEILSEAPLPRPISHVLVDKGGHKGKRRVGNIEEFSVDSSTIYGAGTYNTNSKYAALVAQSVHDGFDNYISIDAYSRTPSRRIDEWWLGGATLVPIPAFPKARIKSLVDPKTWVENTANAEFAVLAIGHDELPVADRNRPWDGRAAESRIFELADGDESVLEKAYLYRDDSKDPLTKAAYKLPIADVIDGRLTIVPGAGVAAAGGRGVDAADIPDSDKDKIRERICSIYEHIRAKYEDWPDCPFGAKMQFSVISTVTYADLNYGESMEDLYEAETDAELERKRKRLRLIGRL